MQNAAQVSNQTIFAMGISVVCTTILPLVILVILLMRKKIKFKPLLLGAAAFFVSQIVLRIPIMSILGTQSWYQGLMSNMWFSAIIVGGFTAGLFEESARYVGAKILKDKTHFSDAVTFGLGHGFCEVMVLIGAGNINNLMLSMLVNTGNTTAITQALSPQAAEQLISTLTGTGPVLIYMGIVERVFACILHVYLSVIVFKAVRDKKIILYVYAILCHTIFNAGSSLIMRSTNNVWLAEGLLMVLSGLAIYHLYKLRPRSSGVSV